MADTVGTNGVSSTSAVSVVSVTDPRSGVVQTFQVALAPDPRRVAVAGVAPTVS